MYESDIYLSVRRFLEEIKEGSLIQLMNNDCDYQEHSALEDKAKKAYINLKLTESQRNTINCLIDAKEIITADYATLSYTAGIKDTIDVLSGFGLILKPFVE